MTSEHQKLVETRAIEVLIGISKGRAVGLSLIEASALLALTAEMQERLNKLSALEAGGVDNWEWYDASLEAWAAQKS